MALEAKAQQVQTPLLGRLFGGLEEDQRLVVLDLGLAMPTFLEAFQSQRLRLDTLSLYEHQPAFSSIEDPQAQRDWLSQHLAQFQLESLDWVCGWSFLNYLDPHLLSLLSELLQPYLTLKTRWHALIEYSSPNMPSSPPDTQISHVDGEVYLSIEAQPAIAPAPRYSPKGLESVLKGFATESAMLLANGWQEYLFRPIAPTKD